MVALNIRMNKAGMANLASYDWNTTAQYDRELVKKLFSLSFIKKNLSVLAFGPTGVGKTILARHLAFEALKAGYSVLFTRADKMFEALKLSVLDGGHDRTLSSILTMIGIGEPGKLIAQGVIIILILGIYTRLERLRF